MMDKKLSYITFVLENCEEYDIPFSKISNFIISNISQDYHLFNEEIIQSKSFESLLCHIKLQDPMIQAKIHDYKTDNFHIARRTDIAQIHLYYNDGSHEWFSTRWDGDNPYDNANVKWETYDDTYILTINGDNYKKYLENEIEKIKK